MTCWMCVRRVFREIDSRSQISGLVNPSARARRTSSSRAVKGSIDGRSVERSRAEATRWAMPMTTDRGRSVSPLCASRTAATTSSTARSLVR